MNSKGQEAAVFELLIAVILMGFVILVGMNALDSLNRHQAEGELNQFLNNLKQEIERVASLRTQREVVVFFPNLFPPNRSELRLVQVNNRFECTNVCKQQKEFCMLLDFKSFESVHGTSPNYVVFSKRVCLDINPFTAFNTATNPPPEGFVTEEWSTHSSTPQQGVIPPGDIKPGRYLLVNSTDYFSNNPSVSVYKYVGSGN